jgi:methylated-DNA-[protein]-cysteine S-methyltransferase
VLRNQAETPCSFPPGTATLRWRGDRLVEVKLSRRRLRSASVGEACRLLLEALDRGPKPAGLNFSLTVRSGFAGSVLRLCGRIRPGEVRTYGELARAAGRPGAARAVGQVMAKNPLPLVIPCHRVVGAGGRLGGYTGGLAWKEFLLAREGWTFAGSGRSRRLEPKPRSAPI